MAGLIDEMIDSVVATGCPAEYSVMFGTDVEDIDEAQIINIEPIQSSVSKLPVGNRWKNAPAAIRSGAAISENPPSKYDVQRRSALSNSDKPSMSFEVIRMLKKVDGSQLPSDLVSKTKRQIYYALIEEKYTMLTNDGRIQLLEMLGYEDIHNWRFVGQRYSTSCTETNGIINIAVKILNRSRSVSALIVGSLLGLRAEYCFSTFPLKDGVSSNVPIRFHQIQELIPKQLVISEQHYLLKFIDYLYDFRGIKEQAICFYMDKVCPHNSFFLIANRVEKDGNYFLEIGTTPVSAKLYSRAEMSVHENATIIICMDMSAAMEFRSIARESSLLDREGIIISGCFGGASAVEALDLRDLAGHAVVIIPELNQEALVSASKFAERCEKAGATSVRIYPWPIIAGKCLVGEGLDCVESSGQDQWKDMLMVQAEQLDDIERPSKFARALCNRALSISDYKKYIIDIGVITAPLESSKEPIGSNEAEEVRFISLGEISDDNPEDDVPLSLEQLINPENSSVLWGPTGTAKSWAADEFAIGIATGTEAFGMPASRPRVVCIMDGEISPPTRKMHIMQLLQRRSEVVSLAEKNIHIRPPMDSFKGFDEAYADLIVPKLKLMKAELFIIDNLQALDSKAGKYNSQRLNRFVQKLEFNGIAVFIVHHSDKEGTIYKGSTDLIDLAQNVFRVDGRKQLRMLTEKSQQVDNACQEGGPVIRLTVEKTKICGLDDCSVIYHLPMSGVWEWVEGELSSAFRKLPESISSFQADIEMDIPLVETCKLNDLHPDEEKVYTSLKGRNYTRSELEASIGFKASKLHGILQKLVKRNLAKKEGAGKRTYYVGM